MSAKFCDTCGSPLRPQARFCPQCGSTVQSGGPNFVPPPISYPPPPPPPYAFDGQAFNPPPPPAQSARTEYSTGSNQTSAQNHTARKVITAVVLVFLILFLLMIIPLPLPFSTTLETNGLTIAHSVLGSADGVSISGSWSTADGGSVSLAIINGNGATVYSADASSGSFSFNATDPPYTAGAYSILPETVQISGTDWSPLIQVGLP